MQHQQQLRRHTRLKRRALSKTEQHDHSLAVIKTLAGTNLFRNSHKIGIYLANNGEIDIAPLIPKVIGLGKRCYLPTLRPIRPNRLWFSEYRFGDRLINNKYGIPEPDIRNRKPTTAWGLDLLLVPLVAFDANGNRIGMGGGFYDRTFAYLKTRIAWRKPQLIGLAHEIQRIDSILPNPWDIPLDKVITESHIYPKHKIHF